MKKISPVDLFLNPPFKYKINDINIIKYNILQTGVNTLSGGAKKGLFKLLYQSELNIFILYFYINKKTLAN